MFKEVAEDRPYPPSGLTTALWRDVLPRHVPIDELIATQNHLTVAALHPGHTGSHPGDRLVHVIKWQGRLYLEDGHHRVVRERLAGAEFVNARVFDLDRHGPVPPPAAPSEAAEGPGLVWVEGKGFRSVHLARALEGTRAVDWHRWSPGTEDLHKPLQYRDAS
jgi:hypothetical protein